MSTKQRKSIRVHWFWKHNEENEQLIRANFVLQHALRATQRFVQISSPLSTQPGQYEYTLEHLLQFIRQKSSSRPGHKLRFNAHLSMQTPADVRQRHKTRRPGRHPEHAQHYLEDSGPVSLFPFAADSPNGPRSSTDPVNPRTARAER